MPLGVSSEAAHESARNGAHWRITSRRRAGDFAAINASPANSAANKRPST